MAAADQSRTPDDCLWLVAGTGSSGPEHPRHFEYCLSFLILVIWEMLFLPGAAWGVSFFPKPQLGLQALILLGAGSPKTGTQGLFVGTMLEPCWNHVGTMLEPDVREGKKHAREGKKHAREGKKQAPGGKKHNFLLEPPFLDREPGKKARPDGKKVWEPQNLARAMLEPCWNHVGTMLEPRLFGGVFFSEFRCLFCLWTLLFSCLSIWPTVHQGYAMSGSQPRPIRCCPPEGRPYQGRDPDCARLQKSTAQTGFFVPFRFMPGPNKLELCGSHVHEPKAGLRINLPRKNVALKPVCKQELVHMY